MAFVLTAKISGHHLCKIERKRQDRILCGYSETGKKACHLWGLHYYCGYNKAKRICQLVYDSIDHKTCPNIRDAEI